MPPLGSRLRAILKTMQKTASRANEKLELLWAGETMRLKQRGHLEHGHHEHVHAGHAASPRLHDGAAPQRPHPFPAAFLSEVCTRGRGSGTRCARAFGAPVVREPLGTGPAGSKRWAEGRKRPASAHPKTCQSTTGRTKSEPAVGHEQSRCSNKQRVCFPFFL